MASTIDIPTIKLRNGTEIPTLGYGTGTAWYKKSGDIELDRNLIDSAKNAIKLGYNHLDGAEVYGTEPELGVAIEESQSPRESLFVTTKVYPNLADIPAALDASLKKLRLDYVDFTNSLLFFFLKYRYLIHAPFTITTEKELQTAWAAMEQVQATGKARVIGVSNFLQSHLETILKTAKVVPEVNQIEFHPYLQHGNLVPWQESQGIRTVGYGGLAPITRAHGGPLDSLISGLAFKYGVSESEILLRWTLDRGCVAITTSSKESRLASYLRTLAFTLNPQEVAEISELGQQNHHRSFWREKFSADDRS
ncbi:hypothetical protein N7478_007989 [Penicillium angulare]|uniref:uncharacterized protein n=1 Tax=Penicillium angulare TaxID=116970 RepID=UPI002541494F|nr:uncharacterized protein N7478_007989 [Penicillium angulare]KAJ5272864.1 hypothetical protein N7478_007989 [Penicillium angulare]